MNNYQPGSLEETQPYSPAQQSYPQMQPAEPERRGCSMGCVLWGCLGTTLVCLMILGVASFAFYSLYSNQLAKYTSEAPLELPTSDISDEEVQQVVTRLEDFRTQFDKGEGPQELVITVDEINALIANNPEMRGKVHVTIVEGDLKAEVSIPVDMLPGGKGRYFNGAARLHVEMEDGVLIMQVVDAEANGEPIPETFMQGFREQNLAKELYKDVEMSKTLKRCEEISIESDRIILKVRPLKQESEVSQPLDEGSSEVQAEIEGQAESSEQAESSTQADPASEPVP